MIIKRKDIIAAVIGEMIITELDRAMRAHFGEYTTYEIMKAVFIGIVKFGLIGSKEI